MRYRFNILVNILVSLVFVIYLGSCAGSSSPGRVETDPDTTSGSSDSKDDAGGAGGFGISGTGPGGGDNFGADTEESSVSEPADDKEKDVPTESLAYDSDDRSEPESAAEPAMEMAEDHSMAAPAPISSGSAKGKVASRSSRGGSSKAKAPAPRSPSKKGERSKRVKADRPRTKPAPPPGYRGGGAGRSAATYAAPSIRAGRHDDNHQYNRFLSFLQNHEHLIPYPLNISERIVIRVIDEDEASLYNCNVDVQTPSGKSLVKSTTYADGRTMFFPTEVASPKQKDFVAKIRCGNESIKAQISREGKREIDVMLNMKRNVPKKVPLDIAIIMDTTGSMSSQIARLKKTLNAIHFQLTQLPTQPDIRFALVAYRDRGDDYITQVTQFTNHVDHFQDRLNTLRADGGGDTPEDLQAALDDAMHKLSWRKDALRMGFIVADAIPHTDYGQEYHYASAMKESLFKGVKWTSVGAGGLPTKGEVIFRQIAQYSMGEYVFVTQGGGGNHSGSAGEASHHVGSNYKTENLDQAIVRIVRRELSYLTATPRDFDESLVATTKSGSDKGPVLDKVASEILRQLWDYSAIKLDPGTPLAILPVRAKNKKFDEIREYLSLQLTLAATRHSGMKIVDRDLKAVAQEMKLQLSDLVDVEQAVPIGKILGAEVLIISEIQEHKPGADLFAKLVRVETGEILSVAKVSLGPNIL